MLIQCAAALDFVAGRDQAGAAVRAGPKLGKRAVIDGAHHREGWRRPASGAVVGPPSEANRRGV